MSALKIKKGDTVKVIAGKDVDKAVSYTHLDVYKRQVVTLIAQKREVAAGWERKRPQVFRGANVKLKKTGDKSLYNRN